MTEHNGKHFAPRWVLTKKLKESTHKYRHVMIPAGRWPGLDAPRAEVMAAFDSLLTEKTELEREAARYN